MSRYHTTHQWIRYAKVKTGICEKCNCESSTDWSNKSGDYRMELDDWQELCRKCHRQYDKQPHMLRASHKLGARKGLIEVTEKNFAEAEQLRRLIGIYKLKHGLPTMFAALAEIIKSATKDGNSL